MKPTTLVAFHVFVEFPAAEPWLVWIEAESAEEARAMVARDTKDAGGIVRDVRAAADTPWSAGRSKHDDVALGQVCRWCGLVMLQHQGGDRVCDVRRSPENRNQHLSCEAAVRWAGRGER